MSRRHRRDGKTPLVTLDKRKEMGLVAKGAAKCLSLSL